MEAVDDGGGAHHAGLLVTAQGVNISKLTGQWRHFIIVADTKKRGTVVRGVEMTEWFQVRLTVLTKCWRPPLVG